MKKIAAVVYRSVDKVEIAPAAAAETVGATPEMRGQFTTGAEEAGPLRMVRARVKPRIVAEAAGQPDAAGRMDDEGRLVKCVFAPVGGRAIVKEGPGGVRSGRCAAGHGKGRRAVSFFRQGIFEGEDPQLIAETAPFVVEGFVPAGNTRSLSVCRKKKAFALSAT